MKHILTILATLSLALGSSFAGCGKIDTDKGKLTSVNAETKTVTIDVAGKEVKRKLAASAKTDDLAKLVGKEVTVTSSHGKDAEVKG